MTNFLGLACPSCGDTDDLAVIVEHEIILTAQGHEDYGENFEIDDANGVRCLECEWDGVIGDLVEVTESSAKDEDE